MSLREQIKSRMDHLQELMEGQAHIDRPEYTSDVIESVSKFWSALDDEDKDYIHCATYALENKKQWNIDK
jgi:hypothetical protein